MSPSLPASASFGQCFHHVVPRPRPFLPKAAVRGQACRVDRSPKGERAVLNGACEEVATTSKLGVVVWSACLSGLLAWAPVGHAEVLMPQGENASVAARDGGRLPLASLFGGDLFGKDPIEPFTLFGTNYKKLYIENLDEAGKVISRERGITVTTCVGIEPESDETPAFKSLPLSEQARIVPNRKCTAIISKEIEPACSRSCDEACSSAVSRYSKKVEDQLGFQISDKDKERVTKSCYRRCSQDCANSGRSFNFLVPFRR
ncbi:hypothetical protein BSKO_00625 [Bryopsis sp. KO-2023]|nr:hypothetical protein BSKO_00625 [Bryopsis sp. KO-2023]